LAGGFDSIPAIFLDGGEMEVVPGELLVDTSERAFSPDAFF
jgi:hypothetical protein